MRPSSGRGKEKGTGNPSEAKLIPIPMRKPEFLAKMKDFANAEYKKKRVKKDTDWVWSGSGVFNDSVFFKDRPKINVPRKAIYILIDVSGSMFGDFDGKGNSLLEYMVGYLPTLAEEFVGEVWWISNGILKWQTFEKSKSYYKGGNFKLDKFMVPGTEARNELKYFKNMKGPELSNFFESVKGAEGAGGGTTFGAELNTLQAIREADGHNSPIIVLTDGAIDDVRVKYTFPAGSKNIVDGMLPPNTYYMSDSTGLKDMVKLGYEEDARPGYFSYEKNIQYYDITDKGKFKVDITKRGRY